jgi:hypothetical protein
VVSRAAIIASWIAVESVKVENDGDFQIRLRADPQFASITNSANIVGEFGHLAYLVYGRMVVCVLFYIGWRELQRLDLRIQFITIEQKLQFVFTKSLGNWVHRWNSKIKISTGVQAGR